jgi:hypothetical protein
MTASGLSAKGNRDKAVRMLHAGLDLSRERPDFHVLEGGGETVVMGAAPPDAMVFAAWPRVFAGISRRGRRSSR